MSCALYFGALLASPLTSAENLMQVFAAAKDNDAQI